MTSTWTPISTPWAAPHDQVAGGASRRPPLSLSMRLIQGTHTGPVVRAFCQGLLPDNEAVLERWGREFQVSAGNPFALLTHVGEWLG
ncbi:HipA N-terminal domain-containing protein [Paractinoplanes atraurantiacus]|nr:HipA N-terminal domain-containing protein [Actinoplanes atraurantiacus]